jgi:mitogen-activated protein kinase 15
MKSPFAATMIENLPTPPMKPLSEMFPRASPDALDMMSCLLNVNPGKRISAAEALAHPFVAQFHNQQDEPACPHKVRAIIDDNTKLATSEYRDRLYQEIVKRKKEARKTRKEGEGKSSGARR